MFILLDIDGVMVPSSPWRKTPMLDDGFPAFSANAVCALNALLSDQNDIIVIISSHRHKHTAEKWKAIFEKRGIHHNITTSPVLDSGKKRLNEVLEWLSMHGNPKDFFVVDDDASLSDLPMAFKKNWLKPFSGIGFTPELLPQ
jgi:hypothetical protein